MSDARPRSLLRRLTPEEIELWLGVTASVARRPGATLPERLAAQPETTASQAALAKAALTKSAPTKSAPTKTPAPKVVMPQVAMPAAPGPPPRLERKLKQKLARGKMAADAAIDLHGFRQAEAFSALRHFLVGAQGSGARVVLVVTGKGGRRPDCFDLTGGEIGVLRRSVPLWLALPEFRHLVVGYEEAAPPHGGAGALYVRLRRADRL